MGLTLAITACYRLGWFWPAFAMTFLLAVPSALYSPAKYGFIKESVGQDALSAANVVVQATVTAAILAWIFFFSVLFEAFLAEQAVTTTGEIMKLVAPAGWFLVGFSLLGLALAYRLPQKRPRLQAMHFDWRAYRTGSYLMENLRMAYRDRGIRLSILSLAGFWSIAQVMVATFPAFAKEVLGETNTVTIQGAMACSGIGIALGSVIAGRVSRGRIETGLVPIGALGIAVGLFLLPGLPSVWSMALDFLGVGIMGGLFLVPLNALIQFNAQASGAGPRPGRQQFRATPGDVGLSRTDGSGRPVGERRPSPHLRTGHPCTGGGLLHPLQAVPAPGALPGGTPRMTRYRLAVIGLRTCRSGAGCSCWVTTSPGSIGQSYGRPARAPFAS